MRNDAVKPLALSSKEVTDHIYRKVEEWIEWGLAPIEASMVIGRRYGVDSDKIMSLWQSGNIHKDQLRLFDDE